MHLFSQICYLDIHFKIYIFLVHCLRASFMSIQVYWYSVTLFASEKYDRSELPIVVVNHFPVGLWTYLPHKALVPFI